MIRRPPRSTLFPSRRSSDLDVNISKDGQYTFFWDGSEEVALLVNKKIMNRSAQIGRAHVLNSSHTVISYAVFCLKKKKKKEKTKKKRKKNKQNTRDKLDATWY